MTRIVVEALHSPGEPRRWTLSERVVSENLDSDHYVTHLVERLRWAAADAAALEAQSAEPILPPARAEAISLERSAGVGATRRY